MPEHLMLRACSGTTGSTSKTGLLDRSGSRNLPNSSTGEEAAQNEAKIKELEEINDLKDPNLTKHEEKESKRVK